MGTRSTVCQRWLCAFFLSLSFMTVAHAHDLSLSGIRIDFRSDSVVIRVETPISRLISADQLSPTASTSDSLDLAVRKRLKVLLDGKPFVPERATITEDKKADTMRWESVSPRPATDCDVLSRIYPEDTAASTVVTELRGGKFVQQALLQSSHPELRSNRPPPSPWEVARQYVSEGFGHILSGPDHIAFLIGLLLWGGSLKSLLKTVTAFTLAHSITLSLAATGVWNPSPRIVEPLIALSIVAVALENLRPRPTGSTRDNRPYYAFGFGLVHGFGFAGALSEVGLPQNALGVALASFNIGVECGQAFLVVMIAPWIAKLARARPVWHRRTVMAGSVAIGLAGAYWFVSRILVK